MNVKPFAVALLLHASLTTAAWAQVDPVREARGLLAMGDARAAVATLVAVPPAGRSPEAAFVLGLAYQDLLRHEAAVEALLQADTTHLRVRAALGRSLDLLGRSDEALMHYRQAYRMDSTDVGIATSLGRLLADAERWAEVKGIYQRLLQEDPENSLLHANLASAYIAMDSVDAAIVHYERAHRLNPRNARVALQLSKVYIGLEQYISARRVVERALEESPHNARLWQRRGDVALREAEIELAGTCYEKAIAYGDSTALNLHNLGVTHYMRGHMEEALALLQEAYEKDTTHVMNVFYLGVTQQQLGLYDEALASLRKTTELAGQPMLADVHAQIAATYDLMEDDAEAIASYRLALNLAEKPELLFHLAVLYDTYYADRSMALRQYEAFLARIGGDELPTEQQYARQRVDQIREADFFEQGKKEVVVTPNDTTGGR